jgi:hypothetical protein
MKELRADDRLLSRRGEGMAKHKRRILQILAITALAVSGFIAAGALAGAGLAGDSTDTTTTTTTTTPPGNEGCTPGFWKQPQHFDSWPVPTTTTLAAAGFTNTGLPAGTTLLQALSFQGGPTVQDAKNILLRAAAAAYLNSFAVAYPLSTAEVVSMVNDALASGDRDTILALAELLDGFNNGEGGCPLS